MKQERPIPFPRKTSGGDLGTRKEKRLQSEDPEHSWTWMPMVAASCMSLKGCEGDGNEKQRAEGIKN